jgi:tetratricopeptide (TPR) repeat protein
MTKKTFLFIPLLFVFFGAFAQKYPYDQLKFQYERLRKEDKNDSALAIAKQMNAWALQNETDTGLRYASSLNKLGILYSDMGDYKAAEPYYRQALGIRKNALGEEHPDYASSLNNLGDLYFDMGDYKASEPYYQQALEVRKKALGEDHPDYASSLNNLGNLYKNMGDYKAAEYYHRQALEINKKTRGEADPSYASSLNNLGNLYKNMGDYKAAEYYYRQALEINKKTRGEADPSYARGLNNLGYLYSEAGKYDSSMVMVKQSIDILWDHFKDSAKIINQIHSLAYVLNKSGKYLEAQDNYFKAIGLLNSGHTIKKSFIYYYDLSENYIEQSKYDQALRILIKYDSICRERNLMRETGDIMYAIGKVYSKTGKYNFAKKYYFKALEIREKILPVNHPDLAVSFNSVGVILRINGDYKDAEHCFKKALEIRKVALGEDHSDYAMTLNNLGSLNKIMGDYQAAEQYYKQALDVRKKALGEDHADYATCLSNLGVLYYEMRDYYAAKLFVEKAYEIRKNAYEKDHPSLGFNLSTLGSLNRIMGDYKSSEMYHKQALGIRKNALGEDHPHYASSLSKLGVLYSDMGDYKVAEPYLQQALEIRKKALGEAHPDYLSTENSFSYLLLKTDREKQAHEILTKNFKRKSIEIADNFEWLNDNQKEAYWKKESEFYDKLAWFANEAFGKVPEAVGLSYNAALITKSKMLEAKISSENYYREVDEIREELDYRRKLIAKMESDGSAEKDKLGKLHKEADSLDKRLILSWPEYAQQKKNLSITWDQVQQNLDKSDAAIEFVRFYNENDSLYYYNALVLKKGDKNPTLIKLCKEKE